MVYQVHRDIENIIEIRGISTEDYASEIGVSRITVSSWINNRTGISEKHMDAVYTNAYENGIRLNKIKEQFYREDCVRDGELLLFHGAKSRIVGELSIENSRQGSDFGRGFYCGESLEQSSMFVAGIPGSSLYMLTFSPRGLKSREFGVNRDWMLAIAYYRGKLEEYAGNAMLRELISEVEAADYIVAPIADNRMFEIIDSFVNGEITDVQCQHSLSATNLGRQYVFRNARSLARVKLLERCYLTESEKAAHRDSRRESYDMNMDKIKLARKQYRNQGKYIEDILK